MSDEKDPYIGETFLDDDYRTKNRRVRVTTKVEDSRDGKPRYRAVVVTDDGNPKAVGRSVRLQAKTLDKRYTKVSH